MIDRAALIAKIKALLAKTVANGCTEAEAVAALEKARQMMADHEVGDDDLTFGGEQVEVERRTVSDRDRIRQSLCAAVGRFCGCRGWSGGFDTIVFCGLASEALFAHWLLDMLADFVTRELHDYLRRTWSPGAPRVRRVETDGFVAGCTARLCERLIALAPQPRAGNGRDLVVAKDALIARRMTELGITLTDRERFRFVDARSSDAGERAADLAQFNRPVDERAGAAILPFKRRSS